MAPPFVTVGELKCVNGRTNIDCNNIGIPRHEGARIVDASGTVDDIEFYWLKLILHLCNVTCRPLTLWPSDCYGPRWAGRAARVTHGDGRTREIPADAARGFTPLMTLLPRHYHARIVKHYHAS
jgi:hypothetical protein